MVDEEKYRFDDYDWLGDMSGFGRPTDVYYGSILLGVIVSKPYGYFISLVIGPKIGHTYRESPRNQFKTKIEAAKTLHLVWAHFRKNR